jgi:hypothetical protein
MVLFKLFENILFENIPVKKNFCFFFNNLNLKVAEEVVLVKDLMLLKLVIHALVLLVSHFNKNFYKKIYWIKYFD